MRKNLIRHIQHAAESVGYTVYSGFHYRMNNTVCKFPAAWLSPLKIIRIEGREEGEITYRAELCLMKIDRNPTEENKELMWAEMEEDTLKVVEKLRQQERTLWVENTTASPNEYACTKHGELSLQVMFDIKVHFYRPR